MALTRNDVILAIEGIIADNEPLTNIAIRNRLGSGSMSTINKYFKEWKDSKKAEKIPNRYIEKLSELANEIWLVEHKRANALEIQIHDLKLENQKLKNELAKKNPNPVN
jgi:hypothetical protein